MEVYVCGTYRSVDHLNAAMTALPPENRVRGGKIDWQGGCNAGLMGDQWFRRDPISSTMYPRALPL